jgi:hypothetical protein
MTNIDIKLTNNQFKNFSVVSSWKTDLGSYSIWGSPGGINAPENFPSSYALDNVSSTRI